MFSWMDDFGRKKGCGVEKSVKSQIQDGYVEEEKEGGMKGKCQGLYICSTCVMLCCANLRS